MESKEIKLVVKVKYSMIASQPGQSSGSCCSIDGSCSIEPVIISETYKNTSGHFPEADLGLGCGMPTDFAAILPGETVLDLGCGAGNDCFVARSFTGEQGQVIGLDFTKKMVEKAIRNKQKLGFSNVDFILGDIEAIPFPDNHFDVVLSNAALNLVPDKKLAFKEIYRVLKPGGHFCISDVVTRGSIPQALKTEAEINAGYIAGIVPLDNYLTLIHDTGFKSSTLHLASPIPIPDEIMAHHLSPHEKKKFTVAGKGIYSITLSAYKI
ncbi:MAG: arsenite methyltransferase [Bacteroidales bacterium]|nr:arsenite methyltransferase [Bacteroidales bacterium]